MIQNTSGSQDSLSSLEGKLSALRDKSHSDEGLEKILNSAQYCLNFKNSEPFFRFLDELVGNGKFQQLLHSAASKLKKSTRPAKNTHAIKQKLALDLQSAPELQEFIGIISDMTTNTITPRGPETEIYPPFKEPIRPVALLAQIALVHQSFPDTTPFWDSFPGSDVKRSDDTIKSMKQCFADALTIYTSHHLENVKNKSNPNVFLTLGSPGIGKSYYSLFLITYVMKLKIPITVTRTLDGYKSSKIGNKEFIAWSIDEYDQDPRLSIDFPQSLTDPFSHSSYLAKLKLLFTKRSKKKRIFITDPIEVESQAAELLNNFANNTSSVSYQNSGNLFFSSHSMPLFGPPKLDKKDPGIRNSDFTYLNMEYTHDTLNKLFTLLCNSDEFQTRLKFSHLLLAPTIRNYVFFLTPSDPHRLVRFFCARDQRECFPTNFLNSRQVKFSNNMSDDFANSFPAAIAFSLVHRYNEDSMKTIRYISPYLSSLGMQLSVRSYYLTTTSDLEQEDVIVQALQHALGYNQKKLTSHNKNVPKDEAQIRLEKEMESIQAFCTWIDHVRTTHSLVDK